MLSGSGFLFSRCPEFTSMLCRFGVWVLGCIVFMVEDFVDPMERPRSRLGLRGVGIEGVGCSD